MALFQLIYMSSMVSGEPDLLPGILESAVRNNQRKGVTGMMLYAEGSVMQVLEGDKQDVLDIFQVIESDPRHSGIFVLFEDEIPARSFASWSMGFRHIAKADLDKLPSAANVFKAHHGEIGSRVQPGEALAVLKSFSEGWTSQS